MPSPSVKRISPKPPNSPPTSCACGVTALCGWAGPGSSTVRRGPPAYLKRVSSGAAAPLVSTTASSATTFGAASSAVACIAAHSAALYAAGNEAVASYGSGGIGRPCGENGCCGASSAAAAAAAAAAVAVAVAPATSTESAARCCGSCCSWFSCDVLRSTRFMLPEL